MKKLTQRLLCVGMALAMLLVIAACGDSGNGGNDKGGTAGNAAVQGVYRYDSIFIISADYGPVVPGSQTQLLTLYSDGTYALANNRGGWTGTSASNLNQEGFQYKCSMNYSTYVYGTYTEVSKDDTLEELTITLNDVSNVISSMNGYEAENIPQGNAATADNSADILAQASAVAGTTVTIDLSTNYLAEPVALTAG